MNRTRLQAQSACRRFRRVDDCSLHIGSQPRRRDVDRLFKIRPFQWIRLVKQGEKMQTIAIKKALKRDFKARNIAFDQERLSCADECGPAASRPRPAHNVDWRESPPGCRSAPPV